MSTILTMRWKVMDMRSERFSHTDGPTKVISIKGSDELHARMRIAAAQDNCSMAVLIERLLDERETGSRTMTIAPIE